MIDNDNEQLDEYHAWPSFVDLLAATVLLLLTLIAVVIVVVTPSNKGDLRTWRQLLIRSLKAQPSHNRIFRVDDSDSLWVTVVLQAEATFPVGRFEFNQLTLQGRDALAEVAKAVSADSVLRYVRQIQIVGHTDATPYKDPTNSFSNWELSATRAAAVARYLVTTAGLDPCLVVAMGKGAHYPSGSIAGARVAERDRRIEIQIVPDLQSRSGAMQQGCDPVADGTVGARTSGAQWLVQVAAFKPRDAANAAVASLKELGYGAFITAKDGYLKVQAGPFATKAGAEVAVERIRQHHQGQPFVTPASVP